MIEGNLVTALLGAMLATTLGGVLNRFIFDVKYDLLVQLGLQNFLFYFAALLFFGGKFNYWFWIVLATSPLSIVGFLNWRDYFMVADNERPWRIGCGIFLLACSTAVGVTITWWLRGVHDIFQEKSYVAVLFYIFVMGVVGLWALLWSRDGDE